MLLSAARMAAVGLAGAPLLVLAWSLLPQLAATWLVLLLPIALGAAIFSAPVLLASFIGTALLTVAAAAPPARSRAGSASNLR